MLLQVQERQLIGLVSLICSFMLQEAVYKLAPFLCMIL